jgi:hypothetical protein
MEETNFFVSPLLPFRRYITHGPRCFDCYKLSGDEFYIELNVKFSDELRAKTKPPKEPISEREKDKIFKYLSDKGGNPFGNLERAEERLKKGFGPLEKIDL